MRNTSGWRQGLVHFAKRFHGYRRALRRQAPVVAKEVLVQTTLLTYLVNILFAPALVAAQQIVTDGRTQTSLSTSGSVTDVTTATISGSNAFNSFTKFDVDAGNTVNLRLPGSTENLINVVTGERSDINGALNSIKNNQVGGNVYFLNPHGMVVGTSGSINVGSLSVTTPAQSFVDGFFSGGSPSSSATQSVLGRSVAISDSGSIEISGDVNAAGDIYLGAGSVSVKGNSATGVSGTVQTGAIYSATAPGFTDVVNTNGYEVGTRIATNGGDIEIVGSADSGTSIEVQSNAVVFASGGSASLKSDSAVSIAGTVRADASNPPVSGLLDSNGAIAINAKGAVSVTGTLRAAARDVRLSDFLLEYGDMKLGDLLTTMGANPNVDLPSPLPDIAVASLLNETGFTLDDLFALYDPSIPVNDLRQLITHQTLAQLLNDQLGLSKLSDILKRGGNTLSNVGIPLRDIDLSATLESVLPNIPLRQLLPSDGNIEIDATGNVSFGAASVLRTFDADDTGHVNVYATNGASITFSDGAQVQADGSAAGDGGSIDLFGAGGVTLGNSTIDAGAIRIESGTSLSVARALSAKDGDIELIAATSLTLDSNADLSTLDADSSSQAGDILLDAGSVAINGSAKLRAYDSAYNGGTVSITSDAGVSLAAGVTLAARSIRIVAGSSFTTPFALVAHGGDIYLKSNDDVTLSHDLTATSTDSGSGNITVIAGDVLSVAASRTISTVDTNDAGDITLRAGGLLDLGANVSLLAESSSLVDDGATITLYGGGGLPLLASHQLRGGGYYIESGTTLSLPSAWTELAAKDGNLTLKAGGDITIPDSFKLSTLDTDGSGAAGNLTVDSNGTLNLGASVQLLAENAARVNDGGKLRLYGKNGLPLPSNLTLRAGDIDIESGASLSVPYSVGQSGSLLAPDGNIRFKAGTTLTLENNLTLSTLDTDGHGDSGDITAISGGDLNVASVSFLAEDATLIDDGGKLTLRAGGTLTLPSSGSSFHFGSVDLESGGTLTVPFSLNAIDGDIRVYAAQLLTLASGTGLSTVDSDGGGLAGDVDVYGGGGVSMPANWSLAARNISIGAGSGVDLSVPIALSALHDGDIHLYTGRDLSVVKSLTASNGEVTLEAGRHLSIASGSPVAAQNIFLDAGGDVSISSNLTATEGWSSLSLLGSSNLDLEDLGLLVGGLGLDILVRSSGNIDITSGGATTIGAVEIKAVGGNVDIRSTDKLTLDNGKIIATAGDFSLADLLVPDGEINLKSTRGAVEIKGEVRSSTGSVSLNVLVNALGQIGLLDLLEVIGDATVGELEEHHFSLGDFVDLVAERFDYTVPTLLTTLLSTLDSLTVIEVVEDFASSLFAALKLSDFLNLGGDMQIVANQTIVLEDNALLSTRQISGTDFANAVSTNDSGDIKLRARNIDIQSGSQILAQVGSGTVLAAGDITMRVFDLDNVFDNILTNFEAESVESINLDLIENFSVDEIRLLAQDYFHNNDVSSARVTIDNSTIKGADLVASAVAMNVIGFDKKGTAEIVFTGTNTIRADEVKLTTDVGTGLFNLAASLFDFSDLLYSQIPDGIPDEEVKNLLGPLELVSLEDIIPTDKLQNILGLTQPEDLVAFSSYFTGATNEMFYSRSEATSGVALSAGTNLLATGDVTMKSNLKTNSNAIAPGYAISGGAVRTDDSAYVRIDGSTLETSGDLTMNATSSAANSINVYPRFGSVNKPFNLTFAWSDMSVETDVEIASGSTVKAADVDVKSSTSITSNVASEVNQIGGTNISLAGAASLIDIHSNAKVGGQVTATGEVAVDAQTQLPLNVTNASSSSASAGLGVAIHNFQANRAINQSLRRYGDTWRTALTYYLNPTANAGKWNAAGAVSFNETDADATATILDGAIVKAGTDVALEAEVVDRPTIVAIAKSNTSGTNSFGGSVAYGVYDNDAAATIGSNASVNAGGDLDLHAESRIPAPWDFDYTDVALIIGRLQASPFTFALTSYVENASSGGTSTSGQSASVNVLTINNTADAHIGNGAQINQLPGTHGDVTIAAEAERNIVAGVGGNLLFFAGAESSAKGAAVNYVRGKSEANAYVGDDADIDGTSLDMDAEADSNLIGIAIQGGRANNSAMEGAATVVDSTNHATTYLGGGTDVNVSGNADLNADASTRALVVSGGLVITKTGGKGSTGGGAALSLALVDNQAETSLRDAGGTRGQLVANNVTLGAHTNTEIGSYSLAGMFHTSSGSGSGIDFVGDAAVNSVTSKAVISTDNWRIDAVQDVTIGAVEESDIDAIAGAVNLGTGGSDGLAGSAAYNMITKESATAIASDTVIDARHLSLTSDLGSELFAIGASARGQARGAGIAGATTNIQGSIDSIAAIQAGSDIDLSGNLLLTADSDKDIFNVAGALAASGGSGRLGMGLGASVSTNILDATTDAYIDASNVDVTNNGNVTIAARGNQFDVESYAVAVGASSGEMVPAAAVSVNEIVNKVRAYVSGAAKHLIAAGSAVIAAISNSYFRSIGGGLSATTQSGTFGGGAATNHHTDTVEAYVGDGVSIAAKGNGAGLVDASGSTVKGLAVGAKSDDQFLTIAAGGAGAGGTSVAASVAVDLLTEDTKAWIGSNAKVNESNTDGATGQSVSVYAYDKTKTADGGGSVALGGTGGVGAGVGVVKLTKNTWANIGNSTTVNAKQDVKAEALSVEDVTALSGAVAFGASVGIAGAGSGVGLTTTTDAHIGSAANVSAGGSVLVSADDTSEVDIIAAAFEGAGAQVAVLDKNTYAYVGNNAVVKADGVAGSGVNARNGSFAISHHAEGGESGEVEIPNLSIQADSSVFKFDIPSERVATTNTQTVRGLAVSATNRDNLETLAVAGSGHISGAVAIAAGVSIIDTDTKAYVGNGATVNVDRSTTGTNQSVLIGAGNDVFHRGVSGAGAGAGATGIGPGVEVTVLNNDTRAYAGDSAKLNASKDIQIRAGSASEAVAFTAALGVGGTVGIAGAVSVLKEDNKTYAYLGADGEAKAGGSVDIGADDKTYLDTLAGAAAVGISGGGVGGSVLVSDIKKDTRAYAGDRSTLSALGNSSSLGSGVKIHANSREDIFGAMAAGSGGYYAGIGGAVAVDLVRSDTKAYIGNNANVNQTGNSSAASNQSVEVSATNETDLHVLGGSLGLAVIGGIAGTVDVGVVRNNTNAYIGDNTNVDAKGAAKITATSAKDASSHIVSASGGTVAVAGAVGVYTLGDSFDSAAQSRISFNGTTATSYADGQANSSTATTLLSQAGVSQLSDIAGSAASAKSGTNTGSTVASSAVGATSAYTGQGTKLETNSLEVKADEQVDFTMLAGGASIGVVGLGAGVGVAKLGTNAAAFLGGGTEFTGAGDLKIISKRDVDASIRALAGTASIVGLDASYAVLSDAGQSTADVGDGVYVHKADDVELTATDIRDLDVDADGASVALMATSGTSNARATATGQARASVGANAIIGSSTDGVAGLTVQATSDVSADGNTWAARGGLIGADSVNVANASSDLDTTAAIGNGTSVNAVGNSSGGAGDVKLYAEGKTDINTSVTGWNVAAGKSGGGSVAQASATSDIAAKIGNSSNIKAKNDVVLRSLYNANEAGDFTSGKDTKATAYSSGGALVSNLGAQATATTTANLDTFTGSSSKIDAGRDVKLLGRAGTYIDAVSDARQGGLVAGGTTQSTATANLTNEIATGSSSEIEADRDVNLSGQTRSWARSYARGGLGGLFAGASTKASSTINDTTSVVFGGSSSTEATGNVNAEAISRADTNAEGWIDSGGLVTSNLTEAFATNNQHAKLEVGSNAKVSGYDVTLKAQVAEAKAKAKAYSKTYAADSTTNATASLSGDVDAKVTIKDGSEVTAQNKLTITAEVTQAGVRMETDAKATIGGGVTGVVIATSTNNLDIDADVDILSGAKLYSNEVSITAKAPKDKNAIWIRSADADAQTVVNYIVEAVQVVREVVNKVTSYLGFLGAVIKWVVTKVVETIIVITEQVLHSSERAVTNGNYSSDNTIRFNGDLYQSGSIVPELIVAQNGTIQTQRNINATVTGSEVVVTGVENLNPAKVTFDATGGTVTGSGTIHHNQTFESISVQNYSNKDLRIQDIGVAVLDGEREPDINIYAQTNSSSFGSVTERNSPTAVTVANLSGSDLIVDGRISNLFGSVDVTNTGGDILATANGRVEANRVTLGAANGGIGATTALAVDLVAQEGALSAPTLGVSAEDGVRLQTAVAEYVNTTPVAGYSITGTITGISAGDGIELGATGKAIVVAGSVEVDEDGHAIQSPTTTHQVASVYNLTNSTIAGGDVRLNGAANTTFNVVGSVRSGYADINVNVDASGNPTSTPGDYIVSNSASAVEVGAIANQGGRILITGLVSGSGSLNVLDGYRHIAVSNASTKDLILGDIDNGRVNSSLTLNGVTKTVPGTLNGVTLSTFGYATGEVTVASSLAAADVLARGAVYNPGGVTTLSSAGLIDSSSTTHLLTASALNLTAATSIGATRALRTAVGSGGLTVLAGNGIVLQQVSGDLAVRDLTSTNGDVTVTAAASIVDGKQDATRKVKAKKITLAANGGSIGSATERFEIDSAGATLLTAQGGVFVGETSGDLNVTVQAGGDADLTVALGGLVASLDAGQDARLTNVRDAVSASITADRDIVLANIGGSVLGNPLTAGRHISVTNVGGNANLNAQAGGSATVSTLGGALTGSLQAGVDAVLEDIAGNVNVSVDSGNDTRLDGIGGTLDAVVTAGADALLEDIDGNVNVSVDSGNDTRLDGIGGTLNAVVTAGRDASLNAVGAAATVDIDAGRNIALSNLGGTLAADLAAVGDASVAIVTGNADIEVTSARNADIRNLGAALTANVTTSIDTRIEDVAGNLSATVASGGDTSLARIGNDATVHITSGGDTSISTIGGTLDANLAATGNVEVVTVAGNAAVDATSGGNVHVEAVGGNLQADLTSAADSRIDDVDGSVVAGIDAGGNTVITNIGRDANLQVVAAGNNTISAVGGNLDANVSAGGDLAVATVGGNADIEGNAGGNASVEHIAGNLLARLTAGAAVTITDVVGRLTATLSSAGNTEIASIGGDADVEATATGNFTMQGVGGNVDATVQAIGSVAVANVGGDIDAHLEAGTTLAVNDIEGSAALDLTSGTDTTVARVGGNLQAEVVAGANLAIDSIDGDAAVAAQAGGSAHLVSIGGNLGAQVVSGGDATLEDIAGNVTASVDSGANVMLRNVGGNVVSANLASVGNTTVRNIAQDATVTVNAGQDVLVDTIGRDLNAAVESGQDVAIRNIGRHLEASVDALRDVSIADVLGNVDATATAGHDATLQRVGGDAVLDLDAGAMARVDTIGGNLSADIEAGSDVLVDAVVGNVVLTATAGQDAFLTKVGGAVTSGRLNGGRDVAVSDVGLGANLAIQAGHDVDVNLIGGALLASAVAGNDIRMHSVGGNATVDAEAIRDLTLRDVTGSVLASTLVAGRDATVLRIGGDAGLDITSGNDTVVANVGQDLNLQAHVGNDLSVEDIGGDVVTTADAGHDATLRRVAGSVVSAIVDADRDVRIEDVLGSANVSVTSGNDTQVVRVGADVVAAIAAGNDAAVADVGGSANIDIDAGHDVTIDRIASDLSGTAGGGNDVKVDEIGGSVVLSSDAGHDYLVSDVVGSVTTDTTAGRFVNITRVAGDVRLDAQAGSDVSVDHVGRDIYAGNVDSSGGNVTMVAGAGSIFVGRIAAADTVDLDSWAGIVEKDHDAATDLLGKDVRLNALGTIGTAADPLEVDSSRGAAGSLTASSGLGVHLVEVDGDLVLGDVRATNGDLTIRALTGDIQLGRIVGTGGGASLFAAGSIRSGGTGGTDIQADRLVLVADSGDIGSELFPLLLNSGNNRASGVDLAAGGGVFVNELTDDLRLDSVLAGGPVSVTAARSILATRADTRIVSGAGLVLNALGGSLGGASGPLHVSSSGVGGLRAATDLYLLSDSKLELTEASAGGTLSLEVVDGGLDADSLSAPIVGILVRQGDADVSHVVAGSLRAALEEEGSQLHIAQLDLNGSRPNVTLLADRLAVDDSTATAGRKVYIDARGNDGGIADLINIRAPFSRLFFSHLYAKEANLDLDNSMRQRVKFRDLIIVDRANIHAGQVDVFLGAGDTNPFQLYISRARVKVRRGGQRPITITPRPLLESSIENGIGGAGTAEDSRS